MENKTVLRKALEHLNAKFKREGQIHFGLCKYANYPVTDKENDLSFVLSGDYYGVDSFEHWEGIYYEKKRDLFFYVGMSDADKFENLSSAFEIKGDMLNLMTTELKDRIKEASLSKSRISVDYAEAPTMLEVAG